MTDREPRMRHDMTLGEYVREWRKRNPKLKRRPAQTEHQFHVAVARYLDAVLRPPTWWTTFPAGGGGKVRGAKLKAMGLRAGVPDIIVMHPSPSILPSTVVIGIELKAVKGRQSPEQREVDAAFDAAGARYRIARSIEDVHAILRAADIPLRTVARAAA